MQKNRLFYGAKVAIRATIMRPVGNLISSLRFHFGPDGPFSIRHHWSVRNKEDRVAKLLRNQDLSMLEAAYRSVLAGEKTMEELCQWLENPRS